jgi:hypothetical protein
MWVSLCVYLSGAFCVCLCSFVPAYGCECITQDFLAGTPFSFCKRSCVSVLGMGVLGNEGELGSRKCCWSPVEVLGLFLRQSCYSRRRRIIFWKAWLFNREFYFHFSS